MFNLRVEFDYLQITDRVGGHIRNRLYPVLVFVHGEDFKLGDSALYPAHILAKREVVVITFNYRLGALGELCLVVTLCLFTW